MLIDVLNFNQKCFLGISFTSVQKQKLWYFAFTRSKLTLIDLFAIHDVFVRCDSAALEKRAWVVCFFSVPLQEPDRSGCPLLTRNAGSWWRPAGTGTPPSDPCWASWSPACSPSWSGSATAAPDREAAAWRIPAEDAPERDGRTDGGFCSIYEEQTERRGAGPADRLWLIYVQFFHQDGKHDSERLTDSTLRFSPHCVADVVEMLLDPNCFKTSPSSSIMKKI